MTFEYFVIEGTRHVYSVEFAHEFTNNAVTLSLTSNYPSDKADKVAAFANMLQSSHQGKGIITMEITIIVSVKMTGEGKTWHEKKRFPSKITIEN